MLQRISRSFCEPPPRILHNRRMISTLSLSPTRLNRARLSGAMGYCPGSQNRGGTRTPTCLTASAAGPAPTWPQPSWREARGLLLFFSGSLHLPRVCLCCCWHCSTTSPPAFSCCPIPRMTPGPPTCTRTVPFKWRTRFSFWLSAATSALLQLLTALAPLLSAIQVLIMCNLSSHVSRILIPSWPILLRSRCRLQESELSTGPDPPITF